jgi:acyl-CoA thioesterase
MPADLANDTAVTPIAGAPSHYSATIPDAWNWLLPAGGVLMTAALRAIRAELGDPGLHPVSATAIFCLPVPPGPVEIRVDLLRRGNAAVQARAALRALGSPGPDLEVSATFARERPSIELIDAAPPDVPSPADVPALEEPPRRGEGKNSYPFLENFESRLALGQHWWNPGWSPGPARYARWIRYLVPQKMPDGALDPLAIPPIADLMPPALRQKLGPGAPSFHAPSLDLTIHFLDPTPSEWLLVSAWARRARAGYATAEAEIWGEDGKLAAYATQTMMLRRASR